MRILGVPSVQSCSIMFFNHVQSCCKIMLATVYLLMTDIANPDVFVCGYRTWICLDINRFYEGQRQPSSGSAWPASSNTVNRDPIAGGRRF